MNAGRREIPRIKCARTGCTFPAVVALMALPPKNPAFKVTGKYPMRQPLCAGCIVDETRVAERMGYTPVGEELA